MAQRYLEEYLRSMGWGSGFNLPVANDENREYEKRLESLQRRVVECRSALDDEDRRVEDLKKHLNRSSVFITNLGKMAQTQRGTVEHARSLNATGESGLKNLKRDVKRQRAELENKKRRHLKIRSDLEKRQKTVDHLSTEIHWDQTAIATLRNSSKDEETDVELMTKYFSLDENTIKESERAYAKMRSTGETLRQELESQLLQTKSAEMMLHRICNQFREVHEARNSAVDLWKGVIDSLKCRDEDLQLLGHDYVKLKQEVGRLSEVVAEEESLLKTAERNTAELKYQLQAFEKSSISLRQHISSSQATIKLYTAQSTLLRSELNSTSSELRKMEKRKSSCHEEAQNIANSEYQLKMEVESIRFHHKTFKFGSSSTDEKFRQLGSLLDEEEQKLANQETETEKRRLVLVQSNNEIAQLKKLFESLGLETKAKMNQLRSIKRMADSQNFQIQQNKRSILHLEIRLVTLREKVRKNSNELEQIDGNPTAMMSKLRKLRADFKTSSRDKAKQENLNGFTESIVQRTKKEIVQFIEEGQSLDIDNENLRILVATYKKDGFGGMKTLQETKFSFQMILLTRNRLMDAVNKRKQRCYSASKNFLELKAGVGERRSEIEIHLRLLDQRKKTLVDDKGRLMMHMKDIQAYLRHWKIKYEFIMTSMSNEADSDGPSEAFLIIKFAQEREYIKREGELWDRRVKEAEKEIEGLQNTLALLSNSNQNFKKSLAPPWAKSSNATKASMIEKMYKDFQILKMRSHRRLEMLLKDAGDKKTELHYLEAQISSMRQTLLDRREELNAAYQEITNQKIKIDRASLLTRRLMRQMEEIGPEELDFIETEIKLRCLREKYEFSIKTLTKTIETFPKLKPWIINHLKSNKLLTKLAEKLEKHVVVVRPSSQKISGAISPPMSQTSEARKSGFQRIRSTTAPPLKHHTQHPFASLAKQSILKSGKPSASEVSTPVTHSNLRWTRSPRSIVRRESH